MNEHVTTLRVRYGEPDGMGIVHHPRYLEYFEIGRTELLRSSGFSYRRLEETGFRLVVTETICRHRAPAHYDDPLTIRTRVLSIDHVRLRFAYRVMRDDRLLAEGETELACLDAAQKPRRLPEEIRTALKVWLTPIV